MRADAEGYVARIDAALNLVKMSLDWDRALRRLDELNAKVEDPTLWDNPKAAEEVMRERRRLDAAISTVREIDADKSGTVELIELAEMEGDAELGDEGAASLKALADRADKDKVMALLSGEADGNDTFIEIHAGAGGTESQDWAEMLQRMYYRWAEQRGYKVEMVDYQAGDQAGIKSATLLVKGENAYGYAKTESGVHRLVRISPFDANARRHTSFASVDVVAEIDDDIDVEVNEADLRVDVYRSSGKGGQHVNKTESAVRLTHIPTGIVVACQRERSQVKNRALAMKILRARIYEKTIDDKRAEMEKYYGEKGDIGWGNQIRSYVFQPYQMVKDLRTGVETGNIQAVMDGDIDAFINGWLRAGGPRTRNKDIKIED